MAHFAQIDDDNTVARVVVTSNDEPDEGYQWLVDNFGGRWLKTSYNTVGNVHVNGGEPFRGNYAGIGFSYDEDLDVFIPPKPAFSEWVLDPDTFLWVEVV